MVAIQRAENRKLAAEAERQIRKINAEADEVATSRFQEHAEEMARLRRQLAVTEERQNALVQVSEAVLTHTSRNMMCASNCDVVLSTC